MARSVKRSFGFAGFVAPVVLVLTLAACGGDDGSSLGAEVEIKPSSFVTTPATTAPPTAAPGEAPTGQPGETTPGTQVHVVQRGEFLSGIAADYEVDMEEIADFNTWPEGVNHPLFPDDQVRIPPGAVIPSPEDDDEDDADSDEETESTEEDSGDSGDENDTETTDEDDDPELCPNGERQGHYTIQDTDTTRVGVAERLNVTVEQLDEANANTPGYSGFFPGLEILVPCGGESPETTEG